MRWSCFKEEAPETVFETVRDDVFPLTMALGQSEDEENSSDDNE